MGHAKTYLGVVVMAFLGILFILSIVPLLEDKAENATDGVKAQGTLSLTGLPVDTETVTVNGKVYTFKTVLTNTDGFVATGATTGSAATNFTAAVNLGPGAGTLYAAATTLHPTVKGEVRLGAPNDVIATAKAGGTGGNALTTTETVTGGSWDAATLGTTTLGTVPEVTNGLTNAGFSIGKWLLPAAALVAIFLVGLRAYHRKNY